MVSAKVGESVTRSEVAATVPEALLAFTSALCGNRGAALKHAERVCPLAGGACPSQYCFDLSYYAFLGSDSCICNLGSLRQLSASAWQATRLLVGTLIGADSPLSPSATLTCPNPALHLFAVSTHGSLRSPRCSSEFVEAAASL